MAELLKNIYNYDSLRECALNVKLVYPSFQVDEFLKSILDESWDGLELKARGRKITMSLRKYLPEDYGEALDIIDKVVEKYSSGELGYPVGFVVGFPLGASFPDFVEVYGRDDENWDLSMKALERYTPYWSAEFAVRPFIVDHEERMMAQMYAWSKHENEYVRRLASEGCRPQLPWAIALTKYKEDPAPIFPILEQLKSDPSPIVRNSVANNLNDISKTNPDLIIKTAKEWYGSHEYTDWIVKHGCRTLLKKGNRDVLAVFGLDDVTSTYVGEFELSEKAISIGEDITFSFALSVEKATKVRLEYGIDYVKSSGKRNRKIFKISEISLKANENKVYVRKHSFADVSTRKHYPGIHSITLIVNGMERGTLDFELKC